MRKWLWILCMGIVMTTITACNFGDSDELTSQGKPTTAEGRTIVTLSIQQMSSYYETIERKFEEKHPDIDLNIQAFKQIGETMEPGDYDIYRKTANTALLSGKGEDIYEIRNLPFSEYMDKKLFLNMDDFMEQDQTLNKVDLEMNILDALKLNEGTYAIPSGFALRAFVGDGSALENTSVDDTSWTWEEFEEISRKLMQQEQEVGMESRYALADTPAELLLQEMVVDNYTEFVDHSAQKAKFDSSLFITMMQHIKQMYEDGVMTSEPVEIGKQMFYSTVLQSPTDFINGPHTFFSNPRVLQKPHEGQISGLRIIPLSQFAIQAKSLVKEEAWQFMVFMLSVEGQSLQEREGFSLLKSVNDKMLNDIQEQVESGTYKLPNGQAAKVSKEQFMRFKQLIHTTNNFAMLEGKVISIIGEEGYSYFSGQKSAEEIAKLIQNRTTTFLNE